MDFSAWLQTPLNWMLLGFGFGFVIFWHELGHFLAAKYVGIKVEQFAVGFGQAVLAWRKGLGFRVGTTQKDYEHVVKTHLGKMHADNVQLKENLEWSEEQFNAAARELGISETEYRLNWIPLGGYVKMLGQDDMKPGLQADDPRAYNRKSVRARMLVVSAGVIMNIILAAIGFMVVFLVGFNSPPAVVGSVKPGSPAQAAGLRVGDRIQTLDGAFQHDFTKIQLNSALSDPTKPSPLTYRTPDGKEISSAITPARSERTGLDFLQIGITPANELRGVDPKLLTNDGRAEFDKLPAESKVVAPGDTIVAINGKPVAATILDALDAASIAAKVTDVRSLDDALQASGGKPVPITVRNQLGQTREEHISPVFDEPFDGPMSILGLQMRPRVVDVPEQSPAFGKLENGDVVLSVSIGDQRVADPSQQTFRDMVSRAGDTGSLISVDVLRKGQLQTVEKLEPKFKLARGKKGLGVQLSYAWDVPQVSMVVNEKAESTKSVASGMTINSVNGKPVSDWRDIREALRTATAGQDVTLVGTVDGKPAECAIKPSADDVKQLATVTYTHMLALHDMVEPRKTSNPFVAAMWGAGETRDAVLQVYLTIKRMTQGSVSYKSISGPLGIFAAGAKFADRGVVWLTWFLSIISANLAVMNFLPIPIVDGGLFTFLIIEKIKGKPVSPRVQAVAQMVGLAILLSVFLLATYQDITRL